MKYRFYGCTSVCVLIDDVEGKRVDLCRASIKKSVKSHCNMKYRLRSAGQGMLRICMQDFTVVSVIKDIKLDKVTGV